MFPPPITDEFRALWDADAVLSFTGEHRKLSNFAEYPIRLPDGRTAPSSEHLYQMLKTEDPGWQDRILACEKPRDARQLGRDKRLPLRRGWDALREPTMAFVLQLRHTQHPELDDFLLTTAPRQLVEGNYWHDNFFGACWCPKCRDLPKRNTLGRLHMARRDLVQKIRGCPRPADELLADWRTLTSPALVIKYRAPVSVIKHWVLSALLDPERRLPPPPFL